MIGNVNRKILMTRFCVHLLRNKFMLCMNLNTGFSVKSCIIGRSILYSEC